MEDIILKIVETDSALRARVAQGEAQLAALKSENAADGGGQTSAQAPAAADKILRAALAQAEAAQQSAAMQLAQDEAALRRVYAAHRGAWRAQLVANCLRAKDGA